MEKVNPNKVFEWGVAARTLAGQAECGDQYLVEPFPNGLLVAVVDGLGHGEKAAEAARLAVATLKETMTGSVSTLMQRCHERLRQSRGVVMSLASFDTLHHTITWLGVGNVEGVVVRAAPQANLPTETLLPRGGVIGYRLPTLHEVTLPVRAGDTLILVTDGIRSEFVKEHRHKNGRLPAPLPAASAQQLADRILADYGRITDDALALVTRYQGNMPG